MKKKKLEALESRMTCSDGWKITGYYSPKEGDYPRVNLQSVSVAGERLTLPAQFLKAVQMEGWGRLDKGWCIGWYGSDWHRSDEPLDALDHPLNERKIAVDPELVPFGSAVTIDSIPELRGRTFTAADVGKAIKKKHLDIYCGEGKSALHMTLRITTDRNKTVRVCQGVNGPPGALASSDTIESERIVNALRDIVRADPEEAIELLAVSSAEGGAFTVANRYGENDGGQILAWMPSDGRPRIIDIDTIVLPTKVSLLPVHNYRELRQAIARREQGAILRSATETPDLLDLLADFGVREISVVPAMASNNQRIFAEAQAQTGVLITRNIPGTSHGVLACAWAVNYIVNRALGHPIGGGLSTAAMHDALENGRGSRVSEADAARGSIIISPSQGNNHGHVGILGQGSGIYSNSSKQGVFCQNYTVKTWKARYALTKALNVLFYNVL